MDWLIVNKQLTNPKNIALATASFLASLKTSSTLSAYLKQIISDIKINITCFSPHPFKYFAMYLYY